VYARTPVDPTDKDYIYRGLDFGLEMIPYEQTILQVIQSNYYNNRFDGIVKKSYLLYFVIPAEAGIQLFQYFLDSRLRGSDDTLTFYEAIRFTYQTNILFKRGR